MYILIFGIICRVTLVSMADEAQMEHEVIRYVVLFTVTKLIPRSGTDTWE